MSAEFSTARSMPAYMSMMWRMLSLHHSPVSHRHIANALLVGRPATKGKERPIAAMERGRRARTAYRRYSFFKRSVFLVFAKAGKCRTLLVLTKNLER